MRQTGRLGLTNPRRGGLAPRALYRLADKTIRAKIPWSKFHFLFGDERHGPPDHIERNFPQANEAMFQDLRAEGLHIHRILGELNGASEAVDEDEIDLRSFFAARGLVIERLPRFGLILLGTDPMITRHHFFRVAPKVLDPASTATNYTVQRVRPRNGIKRWMLDAAAAASAGTLATESSRQ
ncbi:MAG: pgl [Verrucomicrobiales bacterium]|nr:pgl [Verrucomicrobiales bacterium]